MDIETLGPMFEDDEHIAVHRMLLQCEVMQTASSMAQFLARPPVVNDLTNLKHTLAPSYYLRGYSLPGRHKQLQEETVLGLIYTAGNYFRAPTHNRGIQAQKIGPGQKKEREKDREQTFKNPQIWQEIGIRQGPMEDFFQQGLHLSFSLIRVRSKSRSEHDLRATYSGYNMSNCEI